MQSLVDVDDDSLAALWDADFLFGPKTTTPRLENYVPDP
jgi:hypothetical protein